MGLILGNLSLISSEKKSLIASISYLYFLSEHEDCDGVSISNNFKIFPPAMGLY